jgi:hypothetical protein
MEQAQAASSHAFLLLLTHMLLIGLNGLSLHCSKQKQPKSADKEPLTNSRINHATCRTSHTNT